MKRINTCSLLLFTLLALPFFLFLLLLTLLILLGLLIGLLRRGLILLLLRLFALGLLDLAALVGLFLCLDYAADGEGHGQAYQACHIRL